MPADRSHSTARALPFPARLADYYETTKPGIAMAVLMTTLAGYVLGSGPGFLAPYHWMPLLHTLFGTALVAMGAGALNMLLEAEQDALMHRTRNRPLPAGRIQAPEVFFLGILSASVGIVHLAAMVNLVASLLAAASLVLYLMFYTPMKKTSAFCTVVGAVSGALPPLIGWAAARGSLDGRAWILFAILFVWQFPHLLALAWIYREDYARAGFRMIPVWDEAGRTTAKAAWLLAWALVPISLLPFRTGLSGLLYLTGALALGAGLIILGYPFLRSRSETAARRFFLATVLYPPILFTLMALGR